MNSDRLAAPLFHNTDDHVPPASCRQFDFPSIDFQLARRLNRLWHSRLPRFGIGCVTDQGTFPCWAAEFDGVYYAAAIWSNPVARRLPQHTWLELRRLAICEEAPRYTATRMLSRMEKQIRRKLPHIVRLISYQDTEVHTGTIYKAAGWTPTALTNGEGWDRPGRSRPEAQSEARKQRWEKVLRVDAPVPTP